jgi:iron complex outermembrane recepter protein
MICEIISSKSVHPRGFPPARPVYGRSAGAEWIVSGRSILASGAFGIALTLCLAVAAPGAEANQDNAASTQLEEITVTAQKRSENLQNVPISVVAIPADQAANAGIKSTSDLEALTPGLVSFDTGGYAQPHLRGIGTVANGPGVENPVALYVDGVYYGAMSASTLALNNIEQIEVDRGPQGTLFGRNATGGLIQITTRDPKQAFEGTSGVGYGDYQTANANLYVTGGLTDNLAADFAGYYQNQGQGYGRNIFNGDYVNRRQDATVRSKWIYTPSSDTEIKLVFDYSQSKFAPAWPPAPGTTPLGGPPYTGSPWDQDGYINPRGSSKQGGASVRIQQQLSWAELVSLTAYRRSYLDVSFDGGLVTNYAYVANDEPIEPHRQVTEELQLISKPDNPIKWVAGLYLYDALGQYDPISLTGGLIAPYSYIDNYSTQKSTSEAIYGQVTKEVLPATNLTLGLRYTIEKRTVNVEQVLGLPDGMLAAPPTTDYGDETYKKPTWRFSLDHKFSGDELAYISYNRGFKSGGFNDDVVPTTAYKPETLDAYEIGSKTDLFEHRMRLDAAAFFYQYKNIQAVQYPAGFELIYNGAAAQLYGLDLDLTLAVTQQLTIRAGLEAMHSEYTSFPNAIYTTPAVGGGTNFGTFNATGDRVAVTPNFTGDVTAEYTEPTSFGKLDFSVTYSYDAGWYAEPDNHLYQPSYHLVNAAIAWHSKDDLTSVRLWGKNLSNSVYAVALFSQTNGDVIEYAPPRTFGVNVDRRF